MSTPPPPQEGPTPRGEPTPPGESTPGWQHEPPAAPPPPPPGTGPGQPQQPGWSDGGQAQPGTNGLAVAALVCGIVALLSGIGGFFLLTVPLAFILGIAGLILGIVGLRRAGPAGNGRGLAIGGIVTSALGLIGAVLWSILLFQAGTAIFEDPEFQDLMDDIEEGEFEEGDLEDDVFDDLDDDG